MYSKNILLETQLFIDNEYLDKYITLINANLNTGKVRFKTQQHHILPRAYFKLVGKPVDNSEDNLIYLYYKDHVLAHYYLSLCTIGKLKYGNENAIYHVLGNINYLKDPNYDIEKTILMNLDKWQELAEDMAKTRSELYTGRHCKPNTEQHKKQISAKNKGNIYVRKFIDGKWISKKARSESEFNSYIEQGWEKGNIPRSACKTNVGEAIKKAKKNKKCIHKNDINKYVDVNELDKYLADGWILGGHKLFMKTRVKVKKLDKTLDIFEDEVYYYIERGWEKV